MPTRRQERVNARLIQEVSSIISSMRDDRIGFVTITRSDVAPDLRTAKIYVSTYGDADSQETSLKALKAATGFIRRELGKVMQMKVTPEIIFRREKGVAEADEMSQLISEARKSDPNPEDLPDQETAEEDEGME